MNVSDREGITASLTRARNQFSMFYTPMAVVYSWIFPRVVKHPLALVDL